MAVSGANTCMTKIGKNIVIKITDKRVDIFFFFDMFLTVCLKRSGIP